MTERNWKTNNHYIRNNMANKKLLILTFLWNLLSPSRTMHYFQQTERWIKQKNVFLTHCSENGVKCTCTHTDAFRSCDLSESNLLFCWFVAIQLAWSASPIPPYYVSLHGKVFCWVGILSEDWALPKKHFRCGCVHNKGQAVSSVWQTSQLYVRNCFTQ